MGIIGRECVEVSAVMHFSCLGAKMAMVQNHWYHFGTGAPPILVCFIGDRDVHCKYGVLTHGQIKCKSTFGRGI